MVKSNYAIIKEIKEYAIENKIPIMNQEGIDFLTTFIIKYQIKNILEIGTAIGYSSIMMTLCGPNIKVTTIERDEQRYLEAIKNIKKLKQSTRYIIITTINNYIFNGCPNHFLITAIRSFNRSIDYNFRIIIRINSCK